MPYCVIVSIDVYYYNPRRNRAYYAGIIKNRAYYAGITKYSTIKVDPKVTVYYNISSCCLVQEV